MSVDTAALLMLFVAILFDALTARRPPDKYEQLGVLVRGLLEDEGD